MVKVFTALSFSILFFISQKILAVDSPILFEQSNERVSSDLSVNENPTIDAIINVQSPVTSCSLLSDYEKVEITIYNNGKESITDFPISYRLNTGNFTTDSIKKSIKPGELFSYSFKTLAHIDSPGLHHITVAIQLPNDVNPKNDTIDFRLYNGPFPVDELNSYFNGFENVEELLGTYSDDRNNDGINWSGTSPANNGTLAAGLAGESDEWYFTPCMALESGKEYLLTYVFANAVKGTLSNLEIMYGDVQQPSAMIHSLQSMQITNENYAKDSISFTVSNSGNYYFGFHGYQTDSLAHLLIDDIQLSFAGLTRLNEVEKAGYSLYPNPTSGKFRIHAGKISEDNKFVVIRNVMGKKIFNSRLSEGINRDIDFSNQAKGIYFLEIIDVKNQTIEYQSKFVVQ